MKTWVYICFLDLCFVDFCCLFWVLVGFVLRSPQSRMFVCRPWPVMMTCEILRIRLSLKLCEERSIRNLRPPHQLLSSCRDDEFIFDGLLFVDF